MTSTSLAKAVTVVFALTVAACSSGSTTDATSSNPPAGSATLTWNGPTTNSDSSGLTDLAGYRVYQSTTSGTYNAGPVATVAAPGTGGGSATATVNNLASGTYYFIVRAYDSSGNESANALPGEVSKTIP